jgi:hypothetical protein
MVGTEWIEIRKNMPDLEGKSAEIECKQSLLPWNFEREWYCGSESEKPTHLLPFGLLRGKK